MTKLTTYLGTPYPEAITAETADLADIPKNMRDMAYSWENAWGGVWLDWIPVVTQGVAGVPAPLTIDLATSVRRVNKVGRTVHVQARLDISVGSGLTGTVQVYLPYPLADTDVSPGLISASRAGGVATLLAINSTLLATLGNPSVIEHTGFSTTFTTGDWVGLHLCYETL